MKIETEKCPQIYKIKETYEGINSHQQENSSGQVRRFDEVLLDASSRDIEEKILSERVTDHLRTQIQESGREERINALKNAVREGTYIPDEKMMSVCILITEGEK